VSSVNIKTAEIRHEGGMRFVATTGSGHTIAFDDRADDSGPGPTETIAAALGACTAMDVASIALKKRQDVASYAIHVRAEQRDEYPKVFTSITIVHEVEGPAVAEEAIRRCIELSAIKYCPISSMLAAGDTTIHHRYIVRNTGPHPFEAEGEVIVTGPYTRPDPIKG
jgi:putative redox protein